MHYATGRRQHYVSQQMHVNRIKFEYLLIKQRLQFNASVLITKGSNSANCVRGLDLVQSQDGAYCKDVNECQANATLQHSCSQNCFNTLSSYYCGCRPGYRLQPDGRNCVDVDECSEGTARCSSITQRCINTHGSYQCRARCPFGRRATLDNKGCQDINECDEKRGICEHDCVNTDGSYRCTCRPDFTLNPDQRTCKAKAKPTCANTAHGCAYKCVDTSSGFQCTCPAGYRLKDSKLCEDVDECAQSRLQCSPSQVCLNLKGSFRCQRVVCPRGYLFSPQSRVCERDCTMAPESNCRQSNNIVRFILINIPQNHPYVRIRVMDQHDSRLRHCRFQLLSKSSNTPFGFRNRDGKAEIYRDRQFSAQPGHLFDLKFRTRCYHSLRMTRLVFQTTFNVYISVAAYSFDGQPTLQFIVPRAA